MIRYGRYIEAPSCASSISEYRGLNPVAFEMNAVPVEPKSLSYLVSNSGGVPVYEEFHNGNETSIGNLLDGCVIKAVFERNEKITAIRIHLTENSVAFDSTEKYIPDYSDAVVEVSSVTAGYEQGTTNSTYCCFSSCNPLRNSFGKQGHVMMRFFNESCFGKEYSFHFRSIGGNSSLVIDHVELYNDESFVSPIVSFALRDGSEGISDVAGGICEGMAFDGTCGSIANRGSVSSFIKFPSVFLFGLTESSVSFSLLVPSGSTGTVFSKGAGLSLECNGSESLVMSSDGNYSESVSFSSGSWHRITVAVSDSHHIWYIDGNEVLRSKSPYNPFNCNSGGEFSQWSMNSFCFGASDSGGSLHDGMTDMSIRDVCFYDHAIIQSDILREMTTWK